MEPLITGIVNRRCDRVIAFCVAQTAMLPSANHEMDTQFDYERHANSQYRDACL